MAWLAENAPKIHAANVAKGFYDAHPPMAERLRNKEYLMQRSNLIASELFEFYEAYRAGKIKCFDLVALCAICPKELSLYSDWYSQNIKGFAAEELADVVIRCADFLGSINADFLYCELNTNLGSDSTINECCYEARIFAGLNADNSYYSMASAVGLIAIMQAIADQLEIDLLLEIELKLKYNLSRAYKHGKNF